MSKHEYPTREEYRPKDSYEIREYPPIRRKVTEVLKKSWRHPYGKVIKTDEYLEYFWDGVWSPIPQEYTQAYI